MRLFCELFLVAVLIWLGWTKSFHDRIDQIRGVEPAATTQQTQVRQTTAAAGTTTTAPRQPFIPRYAPTRPPTPSGAWMWDPAHRGTLDRPSYKAGDTSAQQAAQQSSQNYWIDGQGVRHSTNATPPPASSP
jgi:hypothetical protein